MGRDVIRGMQLTVFDEEVRGGTEGVRRGCGGSL